MKSEKSIKQSTMWLLAVSATVALVAGCRGVRMANNSNGGGTNNVPTQSPVQHVIVVIMQNNSFDHLFGTFPAPSGQTVDGLRPGVPGYSQTNSTGGTITPFKLLDTNPPNLAHGHNDFVTTIDGGAMDKFAANEGDESMGYYDNTTAGIDLIWNHAQQHAPGDSLYASVLNDAPTNQLYMVAASDNNNVFSVQPFFGPCNQPDSSAQPYTFPNVGDQMNSKGVHWAWFAESYSVCGTYVPQ